MEKHRFLFSTNSIASLCTREPKKGKEGSKVEPYLTIAGEAEGFYEEKKSKFFGIALPVSTPEEAAALVAKEKAKYYDARHWCYAYRLRNGFQKYSDDGEPQGTAGLPILDILQRKNITDCIIIVTRYFGGTLLGTGGLVRSYTAAGNAALANAALLTMQPYAVGSLTCDYNQYGRISPLIPQTEGILVNSDFGEAVTLEFYLPEKKQEAFQKELTELSYGSVTARFSGSLFGGTANNRWFEVK